MPRSEIPVDILLNILEYVDKAGLATMCRVSKICCFYSQDVLYRDIYVETPIVQQTLAKSTQLARRVRSFESCYDDPDLAMALRNMTSLCILKLSGAFHVNIFDGCTFKLDSFECTNLIFHGESFRKIFYVQPSLKYVKLPSYFDYTVSSPLEATCLPNLTRINAMFHLLRYLIPGRPLNEVVLDGSYSYVDSIVLSFLALSTTPIQRLTFDHSCLQSTPGHLLASFLPSLTHFTLTVLSRYIVFRDEGVRGLTSLIN